MLPPNRPTAEDVAEFEQRLKTELDKAFTKYGAAALEPGGLPHVDMHDYAINELVGITRYVQMIVHRIAQMTELDHAQRIEQMARAAAVGGMGRALALMLIHDRRILLQAGMALGEPEQRQENRS